MTMDRILPPGGLGPKQEPLRREREPVKVKQLRYFDPQGDTFDQMQDHARQHPLAKEGDMKLVWVNEGDLYNHVLAALEPGGREPVEPVAWQPPPELIVCRNNNHAQWVRRQLGNQSNIHVISPDGDVAISLRGRTFAKVTVCEGVDLNRDVNGSGRLEALLRSRQGGWSDRAVFIVL